MGVGPKSHQAKPETWLSRYLAGWAETSWPGFAFVTAIAIYILYFFWSFEVDQNWHIPARDELTLAEGVYAGKDRFPSRKAKPYQLRLDNGEILHFACAPNIDRNYCLEDVVEEKGYSLADYVGNRIVIRYFKAPNAFNADLTNIAMEVVIDNFTARDYASSKLKLTRALEADIRMNAGPNYVFWIMFAVMALYIVPGVVAKVASMRKMKAGR